MANADSISKRPALVSHAHFYPSLKNRASECALPKHLQMGVYFGDEITMHFHTAGTDAIWEIPVKIAALNRRLVKGLSPEDALQLGLFFEQQKSKVRLRELRSELDELYSKHPYLIVNLQR